MCGQEEDKISNQGLWIVDSETGEDRFIYYHELEEETIQSFIKPIGGFVFPAGLYMKKALPSVPFYLRDWLPKMGKALLYAPAKSGKSYLCLQIANCIGSGSEFLGIPTTAGKVLYLQFELGESVLQARLLQTGKPYDNVFVGTTFSMKLDTKAGQKQLESALDAVEPDVLILDPKYKAIMGDENEANEMRPICDFLDEKIEAYGCSVLLIDHSGKDITKHSRGSSIWEDWVDSYLQMKVTSKKGERHTVKIEPIFLRHAQLPPEPIEAELGDDFEFHLIDSAPTIKEQVSDWIQSSEEPVSPAELFKQKLGSNTAVYKSLGELVEEGKINKLERGKYEWLAPAA